MQRSLNRVSLVSLVVVVLMAVAPSPSRAITDLGEICFNFNGSSDTIRAEAQVSANIATLNFRWRLANAYEVVGAGTATASMLVPGSISLGLVGTHGTSFFGGNRICSLFATLNPPTFSGPFFVQCAGTPIPFVMAGTINHVACTSAMSPETLEEVRGPGLGE
jgi:hypothetical protein